MSTLSISESSEGVVSISGELTIYEATHFKDEFLSRLKSNPELDIDLSGVIELDCAGVQVMLLLQSEASAAGKKLRWCAHSPEVTRVLTTLNLVSTLGEPVSLVWS